MATAHYLQVDFKARYFTQGELNSRTKYIFIAFHGYGQLGQFFIRNFSFLPEEYFVIVPEGLHRFYQDGMSGRVVASWMTKEDRLSDIENQSSYLNSIFYDLGLERFPKVKIKVFAFSQGLATACRWMLNNDIPVHTCYAWGGSLPIDLEADDARDYFSAVKFISIYGDDDPFFPLEALKEQENWRKKYGIKEKVLNYPGTHKVVPGELEKIMLKK